MISNNFKKRSITSFFLLLLLTLIIFYEPIFLYVLIIIGVISFLEFSKILNKITQNDFSRTIYNIFFFIYIFIFSSLLFFFSNFIQLKIIMFTLIFTCVASDIGGYIFGNIFKGPKITKISPNKTISGLIGSLMSSCIIFVLLIFYTTNVFNSVLFLTGIFTSIFCQLGDLFFSLLKRKANIKDTGNFLPGHGGILDRIDGILLGVPAGFVFLLIFLN